MNIYDSIFQQILRGDTVVLAGIAPATLRNRLIKARQEEEKRLTASTGKPFKFERKQFIIVQDDTNGNIAVRLGEKVSNGFASKIQVLDIISDANPTGTTAKPAQKRSIFNGSASFEDM